MLRHATKVCGSSRSMPRKCAVPGCKSNYKNSAYTNVFYFPKDEEAKRKWIRAIHRDDFVPSTESVVCIKHFDERFIQREDKVRRDDGTWLCVPKSKPKLTTDAIPTIFENQPCYMTTPAPSKRKTPAERLAEQSLRFEDEFRSYLDDDRIKSFDSFKELFPGRLPDCWLKFISEDFVCLYKCDFSEDPHLSLAIKIYPDLSVGVWHKQIPTKTSNLVWLLGKENKCDLWSKFDCLISHLNSPTAENMSNDKHKPKGRMTERRRAQIENSRKRFSSSEVPSLPGGSRNQRFEPAIRDT
ncbi:hypothetical protein JTE90_001714 [Oedothorax gibbosus]|uniref:THAP-type domain-containing protein n=1 Tax=Oedothorax gibbosus TaxID=931172 RepID=A0AAV6TSB9_9ARAC|nr:hypothetical protein JTE90_001714 [Oedothorax gibbosus]